MQKNPALPSTDCDTKRIILNNGRMALYSLPDLVAYPAEAVGGGSVSTAFTSSPRDNFLSIPFILLISRTTAHFQSSFAISSWSKLVRGDQLSPKETPANACQLSSEHLVALARLVPPHRTRAACAEGLVIATLPSPESLSAYR